jgi:hypothetical protein
MFATYILGPIFAFLPQRWRERVFQSTPSQVARATTLSGILESVLSVVALVVWYSIYVTLAAETARRSAGAVPDEYANRIGLFGFVWFWLNPVTWTVAYFGMEGVVRSLAALTTGEAYGTLPLCVADYLLQRAKRSRERTDLPLVADEIISGDATCDMKIASCRDKVDWKYPFTIRYAGAYFQVVGSLHMGAGPRPYVYSLRRLPTGEIARGLKEYQPEDILQSAQPLEPVAK